MSSSTTAPQQGGSRDGAETSRNAELVQRRNNRKVAREGKKNPSRNAEGTSNSAGASEQKRRKLQ